MKRIKNEDAVKVTGVDLSIKPDQTVIVWKATRPLTVQEHQDLSEKLRSESEQTGLAIVLVPFSVEMAIEPAAAPADPTTSTGDPAAATVDPAAKLGDPEDLASAAPLTEGNDTANTSTPAAAPEADDDGDKK